MNITTAEIIQALHDARDHLPTRPEGAHTVNEIADATGWKKSAVLLRLHALQRAKQLECVHVVMSSIDGRRSNVPAYRTIDAPKTKKTR